MNSVVFSITFLSKHIQMDNNNNIHSNGCFPAHLVGFVDLFLQAGERHFWFVVSLRTVAMFMVMGCVMGCRPTERGILSALSAECTFYVYVLVSGYSLNVEICKTRADGNRGTKLAHDAHSHKQFNR